MKSSWIYTVLGYGITLGGLGGLGLYSLILYRRAIKILKFPVQECSSSDET